jgi:hypothetical protein
MTIAAVKVGKPPNWSTCSTKAENITLSGNGRMTKILIGKEKKRKERKKIERCLWFVLPAYGENLNRPRRLLIGSDVLFRPLLFILNLKL